jgi:hypothetical protein
MVYFKEDRAFISFLHFNLGKCRFFTDAFFIDLAYPSELNFKVAVATRTDRLKNHRYVPNFNMINPDKAAIVPWTRFRIRILSIPSLGHNVADPGCLSRITDPDVSIPDSGSKRQRVTSPILRH